MWTIQKLVSKGDYLYAVVPEHPNKTKNNYVLHHRVVMENHLNRLLTSDKVVHHINHDKKDNRIENLEVLSVYVHTKIHSSTGRTYLKLICPTCRFEFDKAKNNSCYGKKPGRLAFCCRNCSGIFNTRPENKNLSLEEIQTLRAQFLVSEYKLHSPI